MITRSHHGVYAFRNFGLNTSQHFISLSLVDLAGLNRRSSTLRSLRYQISHQSIDTIAGDLRQRRTINQLRTKLLSINTQRLSNHT